ncbi:MAG: hypothetical protein ACE5H7_11900, partial [Acidiferrobacterales bacterium]
RCCPTTRPLGAGDLTCSSPEPVIRPTTMPRGQAMKMCEPPSTVGGSAARKQSITHKQLLPVFHTEVLKHYDPRIVLTGVTAWC